MASPSDIGGTASTPDPEGAISGAVLRVIRTKLGLSQQAAAEVFGVDTNTYKSWETGRRPLARVRVQTLRAMTRTLNRLGTEPALLGLLDTAIDVDLTVGQILTGAHSASDHPLATWVHTRTWHDLLAWAVAGTTPNALREADPQVPKPRLAPVDRTSLLNSLREVAEQAGNDPESTLLRRQVFYVSSWDDTATGRDWLAQQERLELRRLRPVDGWTPTWVAGRSLAVARACQGDPDQLRHFLRTQLVTDDQETANLNYWAYWCGEETGPAVSDDFMAGGDLGQWRGGLLLRHLSRGLSITTPYIELTVHTVWALLARRPWLLDEDLALTADLNRRISALLDHPEALTGPARRELEQVHYAVKMKGRR